MASSSNNKEDDNGSDSDHVLRRLRAACVLCGAFLILEVVGGYLSGSLAVLSDAAHLVADLAGFLVALAASHLASLPATQQHTYGLKRTESLAALLSMVSLALVSVGLAGEALKRLYGMLILSKSDAKVDGALMSIIAAIGVLVNVILAVVLGEHHVHMPGGHHHHDHSHDHHSSDHSETSSLTADEGTHLLRQHHHPDEVDPEDEDDAVDCENQLEHYNHEHGHHQHQGDEDGHNNDQCTGHEHAHDHHDNDDNHHHHHARQRRNVNLHAAYLHVMGDLAQSVAVLIAGLTIWMRPTWHVVDPVITLLFCALVFYSTLGVIRNSISVLLEEVPPTVSYKKVYRAIAAVDAVERVHDLHIWSISDGVPALSVHCFLESRATTATATSHQQALRDVYAVCTKHGIRHATIQIQNSNGEVTGDEDDECITCQDYCDHMDGAGVDC